MSTSGNDRSSRPRATRPVPPGRPLPGDRTIGPVRAARLLALAVLALVPAVAAVSAGVGRAQAQTAAPVVVTVDRADRVGTSELAIGVTHTQYSLDPWADPDAVTRGRALLADATSDHNQHPNGWGTVNPNPAPGVYDWTSLDRRVDTMRAVGGTPVITLCCAPDWMTALGTETSLYTNQPPISSHYDDFADLARRVAQRYPDVRHFVVWNEMKGLWNGGAGNWDMVAYTELYNRVHAALKSVDPGIQVGGPYLVIEGTDTDYGAWFTDPPITRRNDQVIDYWLEHAAGADFIAVDRAIVDFHDHARYSEADKLDLTHTYGDIPAELRARTSLPIWYIEQHFAGKAAGPLDFQAVGAASMLRHQLLGGASVTFQWEPEQHTPGGRVNENLFSSARQPGGAQPYPLYFVYRLFHRHFGPGTPLVAATSSSPTVEVLASDAVTLVLNKRDQPVEVTVDGVPQSMAGYEVRLLDADGTVIASITEDTTAASAGLDQQVTAGGQEAAAGGGPTAPPAAIADQRPDPAAATAGGLDALALDQLGAATGLAAGVGAETVWLDQFSAVGSDDRIRSMAGDGSATYVVGGTYGAIDGQPYSAYQDGFLRRYDPDGTVAWTRLFGTNGDEGASAVALHGSGDQQAIYVAYSTDGALGDRSRGLWDAVVRRYDPDGRPVWTRQFGSFGDEFVTGIAADDTGVYVVGNTDALFAGKWWGYQDGLIRKYAHDGSILWARQFGTADPDYATSVATIDTPDGPLVAVAGATAGSWARASAGLWDGFVRVFDAAGNTRWTRQFGTAGDDRALDIAPTHRTDEPGFYVAGRVEGALPGQQHQGINDGYLRRYDTAGNELWTRQFGTPANDWATRVAVGVDGPRAVGWTRGDAGGGGSAGAGDVTVHPFTADGTVAGPVQQLGSGGQDEGHAAVATLAGLYVGGYTNGPLAGTGPADRVDAFAARLADGPGPTATDEFARTVDQGWAAAESGGGYLLSGGLERFAVTGGRGAMVFDGPGRGLRATLPTATADAGDVSVLHAVGLDRLPAGSSLYAYAAARYIDPWTEYRGELRVAPSGRAFVRGVRVERGWFPLGAEVEVPGLVVEPGRPVWVRTEVTGTGPSTVRVRAWPAGTAEPDSWHFEASDSSPALQQPGGVGLRAYVPGRVTNTPLRVWFDDLLVAAP